MDNHPFDRGMPRVELSTFVACWECWMRREMDDGVFADALLDFGRDDLAGRLQRLQKYKGKKRRDVASRLTRDIIALMPRLRIRRAGYQVKRTEDPDGE